MSMEMPCNCSLTVLCNHLALQGIKDNTNITCNEHLVYAVDLMQE